MNGGAQSNGLENELRKEILEKEKRSLTPLFGIGHYFGPDKAKGYGGPRSAHKAAEVERILKLASFGQREVNLKFFSSENVTAEFEEWKLKHQTWRSASYLHENLGGDDVHWILSIKSPVVPGRFRADVDEIGSGSGTVYASARGVESVRDGDWHKVKFRKTGKGSYIRWNITFLT